jgi:GDPmannose 4,6-dehydratase
MRPVALITGVTGQDGPYLTQILLKRGYVVIGTSRRFSESTSYLNLENYEAVKLTLAQVQPEHVYHLASPASVALSFDSPIDTMQGIYAGLANILKAVHQLKLNTRVFYAGSTDVFGQVNGANETSALAPRSPYGIAKAAGIALVRLYREAYGLYACTGIMSNHESPTRGNAYVTQKLVRGCADIAETRSGSITFDTLHLTRDWGWAPEYMECAVRMLEADRPRDIIIATGQPCTLLDFVKAVFSAWQLDWRKHVAIDASQTRPTDITISVVNPALARETLNWKADTAGVAVALAMVAAEKERRLWQRWRRGG